MATREHIGELLRERGLLAYPAVEVGVADGWYSSQILSWGVPLLYLVDLWASHPSGYGELSSWDDARHQSNLDHVISLLSQYKGKYQILRGWSYEMCDHIEDSTLGFAFIDASHDYENVTRDLHCYWPKLVEGGIMGGHDWPIEGVQRAVTDFAFAKNLEINLLPVNEGDVSFWLELT